MPKVQRLTFTGPHPGEIVEFTFTNPAQINQAWGQIIAHMGQEGIMGDHSSSHGAFTPDPFLPDGTVDPHTSDPSRDGVGNASEDDPRFDNPDFEGNNLAVGGNGLVSVHECGGESGVGGGGHRGMWLRWSLPTST